MVAAAGRWNARVELTVYADAAHTGGEIATTRSKIQTAANNNNLNAFGVAPPCIVSTGTHAHIRLLDDHVTPGVLAPAGFEQIENL
jgi:hypothetical protein